MLLALGVAAFFFFKVRRLLPERSRAAELAPAETIFFVQFPNLRQTALRLPKTDLYQIWREPEVQTFLEKPQQKAPWMRAWAERFEEMIRVAPGEFFVAVTSIEGPQPGFVGGFSFAGSQRNAEALAKHLREQLLPAGEIVSSSIKNWHFFASDAAGLEAMLARFEGKPGPALAADPIFQQSIAPLGVGQDLVLYGKPDTLAGYLDVLTGLGGFAQSKGTEPIAMATKFDGAKLHDIIFLRSAGPAREGALSRRTLPLAPAETLLYYVTDRVEIEPGTNGSMLQGLLPSLSRMEKGLAERGLTWSDLPNSIGPESAAMFEWPEDAALPTLLLASEIRDAEKLRSFREAMTHPTILGAAWLSEDREGIAVSSAPSELLSVIRPACAMTDHFALLGLSPEAVMSALPRVKSPSNSLGQTGGFQAIAGLIPDRAVAFAYLDFQRLFERTYRMARPVITLSLAFSSEAGAQFDAGKLPPVEAITKHLSPTVLTQTRIEGGTVIESVGSLTIPELLVGVAWGAAASGLSDLSSMIPGGSKSGPAADPRKPRPPADGSGAASPGAAPTRFTPEKTAP